MKYDDLIELLKLFAKALLAPISISNSIRKSATLKYPRDLKSNNKINNSMNNSIYAEPENSNIEYNQSVLRGDNKSYNDNKNNGNYNNDKQDTSSNPQGVIDSIAEELTTVRLKQAIILSEIVGKPRSKTRKKRSY